MQFKIRASAIGKIMTGQIGLTDKQQVKFEAYQERANGNGKPLTPNMMTEFEQMKTINDHPSLPQTAKSYVELWLKERLYQSRKEINSKYTQKGHETEDDSIDFVCEKMDLGFIAKNETSFEKGLITGTPDVVTENFLIDVKGPFDFSTFPLFETEIPNIDYFYQGQGYMFMTGVKKYHLCYVLNDTPEHMIEKEARFWCRMNGIEELDDEIFERFRSNMTYDNVPDELKLKTFTFEYDEEVIKEIQRRVQMCQEYLEELIANLPIKIG